MRYGQSPQDLSKDYPQRPTPTTNLGTNSIETRVNVLRKCWARKWKDTKVKSFMVASSQDWVNNFRNRYRVLMLPCQALCSVLHIHMLIQLSKPRQVGAVILVIGKLPKFTQLAMVMEAGGVRSWIRTIWPQNVGTDYWKQIKTNTHTPWATRE